jgi:PIN domain nuclease of toxin-antitoxin system
MKRKSKTASLRKKEEKHFGMSIDKRCCLLKNAKAFAKKGEKDVRLKKLVVRH